MNSELLQMKNLGRTSTQWLHASGIHSAADLRRIGAAHAYHAVRTRGFPASMALMYAIEGALLDQHWCELSHEVKASLNEQLKRLDQKLASPREKGREK